jgi:sigma-B regulation protein RsbU (phosphoserine phosphatase)
LSSLDLAEREKRSVVQDRTGILFFKWGKGIDRLAIFNSSRRLDRLDENLLSIYTRNIDSAMEQIEQLKMQETLETARKIQMAMMPTNFAEFSNRFGIDLHAYLSPANEVGGDLYDFFELDDGHICLALGDVSDKGVPAALFMTMAKTLIRHVAKTDICPSEVLAQVNNELCRDNDECMFVTLFLAFFDCRTGILVYANAGHNPPYLVRSTEQLECLDQQPGVPLGTFEAMPYRDYTNQLGKGDGLFMFSDGINEAMNSEEQLFGTQRMEATLAESGGLDAQTSIINMIESVKAFTEAAPQSDDMTILFLKNSAG